MYREDVLYTHAVEKRLYIYAGTNYRGKVLLVIQSKILMGKNPHEKIIATILLPYCHYFNMSYEFSTGRLMTKHMAARQDKDEVALYCHVLFLNGHNQISLGDFLFCLFAEV